MIEVLVIIAVVCIAGIAGYIDWRTMEGKRRQ